MSTLARFDRVLRAPADLVGDAPHALHANAADLVAVTGVGAAAWGVVVGTYHGGWQLLLVPLKAPLLFLVPPALCLAALRAILAEDPADLPAPRLALAALVGAARAAVLCAATAPLVWLLYGLPFSYDAHLVGTVLLAAPGAAAGLWLTVQQLGPARLRWGPTLVALALLGATSMQTAWLLRPFLVHPGGSSALLRPLEDDGLVGVGGLLAGCAPTDAACLGVQRGRPTGLLHNVQEPFPTSEVTP